MMIIARYVKHCSIITSLVPKIGTPVILEAYNFVCRPSIEVKFKAKL